MSNWCGLIKMKRLLLLALILLVSGCALQKPIPDGYTGPVATIIDSGFTESSSKAQLFVLSEIDDNRIEDSLIATRRASHGQGFFLTTRIVRRQVPARQMKVKLVATHTTAAPIHAMFS